MNRKLKIIFITLLFFCFKNAAYSENFIGGNFSLSTGAVYGTSDWDSAYDVKVDTRATGGPFIYVLGYTYPDYYILKYDKDGIFKSSATLPGGANSNIYYSKIAIISPNIYAEGSLYNSLSQRQEIFFVRYLDYNNNLILTSSSTYSSTSDSLYPNDFVSDGKNLYTCFSTNTFTIVKLDNDLNITNVFHDSASSYSYCYKLAFDDSSNIYISGYKDGFNILAKYDNNFNLLNSYNIVSSSASANNIAVNPINGDVFVANSQPICDPVTYKCDSSNIILEKYSNNLTQYSLTTFSNPGNIWVNSIVSDSNNVYVLASLNNNSSYDYGVFVFKASDLSFKNSFFMDAGGSDYPVAMDKDNSGNIYVTGNSDRYHGYTTNSDIATVRYNPSSTPNNPPVLMWLSTADYWSDGLNPESGISKDTFNFKVKYIDADGDSPSYVKLHLYKDNIEISGSPFDMTCTGADPRFGLICEKSISDLAIGNYTYSFEAMDNNAASLKANGYPTNPNYGPNVSEGFIGNTDLPQGASYSDGNWIDPKAIAIYTSAEGDYVYGLSSSNGSPFIIRFSTSSTSISISTKIYSNSNYYSDPNDIITDKDGNVYISEYVSSESKLKIKKIDKNLTSILSQGEFGSSNYLSLKSMVMDENSNLYVLAGSYSMSSGYNDMKLIKFDSSLSASDLGNYSVKANMPNLNLYPSDISISTKSGNIFILAYYNSNLDYKNKLILSKADYSFNISSTVILNYPGNSGYINPKSIDLDKDDNIFITAQVNNGVENNILLLKYDSNLNLINSSMYNAGSWEDVSSLAIDKKTGDIYISGMSSIQNLNYTPTNKLLALKYDNNLVFKSSFTYGLDYNESNYGSAIALNSSGAPYVFGYKDIWGTYSLRKIIAIKPNLEERKNNISINVKDKANLPLKDIEVSLIPFNSGKPDLSYIEYGKTDGNGNIALKALSGINYFIALSTPDYSPTIKDQLLDPYGNFNKIFSSDTALSYILKSVSAKNKVRIKVNNIYTGSYIMGEVYLTQTRERVSYGIWKATDSSNTFEIYNVPNLTGGTYGIDISIPGWLSTSIYPMDSIPNNSVFNVDMSSSMAPTSNYTSNVSSSSVYFSGFIKDNQGNTINGAKVRLYNYCDWAGCDFSQEVYSDSSGKFSFSGLTISTNTLYLSIYKVGYVAKHKMVSIPSLNESYSLEKATYSLRGYIKYGDSPMSYTKLRINPAGRCYNNNDSYGNCVSGAQIGDVIAYTDGDGMFNIEGLPDGNFDISIEDRFFYKNLNSGNNSQSSDDDIRITISSDVATPPSLPANNPCSPGRVWILDSSGTCKGVMPYVFNIGTQISTNAVVSGNIIFTTTYNVSALSPLIIDKSSAVIVGIFEDCDSISDGTAKSNCYNNRKMFFKYIYGSYSSNSLDYSIYVSSFDSVYNYYPKYWLNIMSNMWAKLNSFDNNFDFTLTTSVIRNINLVPSGRLNGYLKNPDGSFFKPMGNNSVELQIRGKNISYDDGTSINQEGYFEFSNIPPGKYDISVKVSTEIGYAPIKSEDVIVNTGKTTTLNLSFKKGFYVQPQIYGLPEISTPSWSYTIIAVPSGQVMNQKYITELFFENPRYSFHYDFTTSKWSTAVMEEGQYDFYLLLASKYCTSIYDECPSLNFNQFANFIGRVKNISIKKDSSNANLGTASQPIPINIVGSIGQEYMSGSVKGDKIFTDDDYERLFANFDSEIMPLIPAVMIYDNSGELRAFSHVLPDEAGLAVFENSIREKNKNNIKNLISNGGMKYYLWGIAPGKYTAVFANPNYPPITKIISLPNDKDYPPFNFDDQKFAVGSVSAVVKSSTTESTPLRNASVYLSGKTIQKYMVTDSSGIFRIDNLPSGSYKVEIYMDGFVKTGKKFNIFKDEELKLPDFYLEPSTFTITGRVLLSKFPSPQTKEGIKVFAYDETLNTQKPKEYLPTVYDLTDENGYFTIKGVVVGHNYKVSVIEPEKMTFSTMTEVSQGENNLGDIVLLDLPPQIVVKLRRNPDSPRKVDVIIYSPRELVNVPTCKYNPGVDLDTNTAVSLALVPGANNSYLGQFTTSVNSRYYSVNVSVGDITKVEKTVVYDSVSNSKTEQYVQDIGLIGGSIQMDQEKEEYSGIDLDPGSLTQTSTAQIQLDDLVGGFFRALPSVRTIKTNRGDIAISDAIKNIMASDIYNIDLANAQTNKSITLNLKYDKEKVINTDNLKIYQYVNGEWKEVPGSYTIDPMLGTVSVDIDGIESAYESSDSGSTPLSRKKHKMSAISPKGYYVASADSSSQSAQFAVFSAKPDPNVAYSGSSYEAYNMPNPFNLKDKTITNIEGTGAFEGSSNYANGSYTTRGTLIKYHIPSGKNGNLKFVIYNTAGEKVRTLDEGYRNGGYTYYSEWDGKNDKNEDCASGVYFLMSYMDGDKLGKPHKMAIIK